VDEDTEKIVKASAVILIGVLLLYAAAFALALAAVGLVVDVVMRMAYNGKLADYRATNAAVTVAPHFNSFFADVPTTAPEVPRVPALLWEVSMPIGLELEVYRTEGEPPGDIDDAQAYGTRVLKTTKASSMHNPREDVVFDHSAPEGRLFYAPYLVGGYEEKTVREYSLFDFATSLQFDVRRRRVAVGGGAAEVLFFPDLYDEETHVIEDQRSDERRLKDDVISSIKKRKERDAEIETLIREIENDVDLTDDEKALAIETLEVRLEAK